MTSPRLFTLTTVAMLAFAGNSLLCRLALTSTAIDAAQFTAIRVCAGAITLLLLFLAKHKRLPLQPSWTSALALFSYAACFSFAYVNLSAAAGALLLFAAVQASMIGYGIWRGERITLTQLTGILIATAGLIVLLLPGWQRPPLGAALMMVFAGCAWALYSLKGKTATDPLESATSSFLLATPLALLLVYIAGTETPVDRLGAFYAVASGAFASGLGYAIWYAALPQLRATTAATVQLTVPAIATIGGAVILAEPIDIQIGLATATTLAGVGLYLYGKERVDS